MYMLGQLGAEFYLARMSLVVLAGIYERLWVLRYIVWLRDCTSSWTKAQK
jgi:hypothetical protein